MPAHPQAPASMRTHVRHPARQSTPQVGCNQLFKVWRKHQTIMFLPDLDVCPGHCSNACCADKPKCSHDVFAGRTGRQALASPAHAAHVLSGAPVSPSSGNDGGLILEEQTYCLRPQFPHQHISTHKVLRMCGDALTRKGMPIAPRSPCTPAAPALTAKQGTVACPHTADCACHAGVRYSLSPKCHDMTQTALVQAQL